MTRTPIPPAQALQHFFDQPINLHLIAESDGTLLRVSRGFEAILGYQPDTLIGQNFLELVHPEDHARTIKEMEALAQGQPTFSFQNRYRHTNGSWHLLHWSATFGRDEELIYAVASDITDQKAVEIKLAHRIGFERLISEISSDFVGVDTEDIDAVIEKSLASLGSFKKVDRAYVFQCNAQGTHITNTHEWTAPGITAQKDHLVDIHLEDELLWLFRQIQQGPVTITDIDKLPAEAAVEREHFAQQGIQSLIALPMNADGRLRGIIGFDAVRAPRTWTAEELTTLRIVAETFTRAIERTQWETARNASEKKFRTIFQHANDAFYVHQFDADGMPTAFTEVNDKACAMLGYSREELLTKSPMDIDATDLQHSAPDHLSALFERGHVRFEGHHLAKSGAAIAVDINAILFTLDDVPHILSIVRDMRQQKEAQALIQESRDRLQMAMDVSGIGLWEVDLQHRTQTVNVGFAQMLGYGMELSTTSIDEWDALLHPKDAMHSRQQLEEHVRGERTRYQADIRVRHTQGHWVWIRAQGKVVDRTPTGKPVRIIGTASDITLTKEREQRQEQLLTQFRQMMDPLDQGVAIVTHDRRFSYINTAGQHLLGMTVPNKGPKSVTDVFTVENWQRIASKNHVDTGSVQQVEIDIQGAGQADQEQRLLFEVVPHRDDAGRPEWLLTFEPVAAAGYSLIDIDDVGDAPLLTICSKCHDVKTGPDEWEQLAVYLNKAYDLLISHGLCPDCLYEFTRQMHHQK